MANNQEKDIYLSTSVYDSVWQLYVIRNGVHFSWTFGQFSLHSFPPFSIKFKQKFRMQKKWPSSKEIKNKKKKITRGLIQIIQYHVTSKRHLAVHLVRIRWNKHQQKTKNKKTKKKKKQQKNKLNYDLGKYKRAFIFLSENMADTKNQNMKTDLCAAFSKEFSFFLMG